MFENAALGSACKGVTAFAGLAMLAACSATPPADEPISSGPVDPLDAFEQVGDPQRDYVGVGRPDPDNLSSDIERLQDARRQYHNDQARQSAEVKRHQAECSDSEEGQEVRIDDGNPEPAVYCPK